MQPTLTSAFYTCLHLKVLKGNLVFSWELNSKITKSLKHHKKIYTNSLRRSYWFSFSMQINRAH